MKKPLAGFTIVELVVVIVVIGILAGITILSYSRSQLNARDTAIKNAAAQTADALQLWSTRTNLAPSATNTTVNGIAGSTSATGWVQSGKYTRTIEDVLVDHGYLSKGFSSNLQTSAVSNNSNILMFYACSNGLYAVYAALNDTSKQSEYQTKANDAGCPTTQFSTSYKMNYVLIF